MKTYQELVDEASKEFSRRYKAIRQIKHLIPIATQWEDKIDCTYSFIDCDGINLHVAPMTVKEILIFLDEEFWSKGIKTQDPIKGLNEIRIHCYDKPGLYFMFNLKEGDGCHKIQIGVREIPEYEWRCLK